MTILDSGTAQTLNGTMRVPGDKSISHRALILGAVAVGRTTVTGLLEGADVLATAAALRALGAGVDRSADGVWTVTGRGVGGLVEPESILDLGNSGTAARLIMGAVGSHPITCFMTGDASLRGRPMMRIAEPLRMMGAEVLARAGGSMPLAVIGPQEAIPITYELPVASAQVKSAILLAGLNAPGRTTVIEPRPSRDHTELMFQHFGIGLEIEENDGGGHSICLDGHPEIEAHSVEVPADPSSAAFPGVAALLIPGSRVRLPGVGLNPTRTGLFECLEEMGAEVDIENRRTAAGEPVGDLIFHGGEPGALSGIDVPAERVPRMIDEYPILAVSAAMASGTTRMYGLSELRVKESDRLAAITSGLGAAGIETAVHGDTLVVEGCGGRAPGGGRVDCAFDHRIAMAFLVLGLAARNPMSVVGTDTIETSFPGFAGALNGLGARITEILVDA